MSVIVVSRSLALLFIAVSHRYALEAVAAGDRCGCFLHRQPVVYGLVALVVQGSLQHSLQSEIAVGLLQYNEDEEESFNSDAVCTDTHFVLRRNDARQPGDVV